MKFVKYPKIRQFKDVIRSISSRADYKGKDEEGNPIYEESEKPVLEFTGTVKLHGTNAQISYTPKEGVIAGKRNSLLSKDDLTSHYGFNRFVHVTKKEVFEGLCKELWDFLDLKEGYQLIIYGEWAGKEVQKGVALTELPKSFYIFDILVYNNDTGTYDFVEDIKGIHPTDERIHNITDFETYKVTIDFNNPKEVQDILEEFTDRVEEECPVSKELGVSGTGEGIVWKAFWKDELYAFKVKGDKHANVKREKKAPLSPEFLKNINEFVNYACTVNRVEQGMQETEAKEKRDTGKLLAWVANDIISEESDTLDKSRLDWKQVAQEINKRARDIYFEIIEKI